MTGAWYLISPAHLCPRRPVFPRINIKIVGTSLVVQWLSIHLPVKGTWVQSLEPEVRSHILQSNQSSCSRAHEPQLLKPAHPTACAPQQGRPRQQEACVPKLETHTHAQSKEEPERHSEGPAQPLNKQVKIS